ncbi:MAG: HDOD domain-containing protein [Kiritimatiellae bacterium]|nr:HDOD domain-containing protein [Kiritimatiellia bacterium]
MSENLIRNLESGEPVVYKSYGAESEFKHEVISSLQDILRHVGKPRIFDHVSYCLQELIDNAVKANLKRIYFQEQELRIDQAREYEHGMRLFKDSLLNHREHYLEQLEPHGLWVTVGYRYRKEMLEICVENNTPILDAELKKIHDRIDRARIYETLPEIFEDITDDSESAGLGIVMLCMILRRLGVPDKYFRIACRSGVTSVDMTIPFSCISDEDSETISDSLIHELNTIPQFPESIVRLKGMLSDSQFKQEEVLGLIKRDPALTAEILRMCNSAYYRRRNKIESPQMALGILGVRGMNAILDSWGARKALEAKYPKHLLEPLWAHASEVAYISSLLCVRYKCDPHVTELAYNAALLHDIGRIVLEGNYADTYVAMKKVCSRKKVSLDAVEDLIEGVNHTILGAKLAEKWNLPDAIVATIRYYRLPLSASENMQQIAKIVALSHILANLLRGDDTDYQTENLPKYFGFSNRDTLSSLVEEMRAAMTSEG